MIRQVRHTKQTEQNNLYLNTDKFGLNLLMKLISMHIPHPASYKKLTLEMDSPEIPGNLGLGQLGIMSSAREEQVSGEEKKERKQNTLLRIRGELGANHVSCDSLWQWAKHELMNMPPVLEYSSKNNRAPIMLLLKPVRKIKVTILFNYLGETSKSMPSEEWRRA